jgi:hypothetical protein
MIERVEMLAVNNSAKRGPKIALKESEGEKEGEGRRVGGSWQRSVG